ncbi:MAG: mandelate racemase/muconate lactonizing enzyme family protein [Deltaproteobacteria bacterium]|nr:mandelate racemase/muconate lactonizing enzyme family protein [Deltaproteobacteria bacterium]
MKITNVKVIFLKKKLNATMAISRGGFNVRSHTLVQVETDEGITGLGEGVGNAVLVKSILEGQMAEAARGLDPMNIEMVREKLLEDQVYFERKGSAVCAASAIEMACWDIKGKALNVPVYQLLGGLYRDKLEAYVSDIYWEKDLVKMAKNAERILKMGFHAIKAHIGRESPQSETERVKALREVAGSKTPLMIDLNAGYKPLEALQAARLWEPYNPFWIEEPLKPSPIRAFTTLRSRTKIPIAAGENEFGLEGFKQLFDQKAIDVAMPDIGRAGGLLETKNICTLAQSYGVEVSPHNFSSGVLLAATLHLMASTPNTRWLEWDTSGNAVYEELFIEPLQVKDGFVGIPDQPGLGVQLKKEILEKFSEKV